MDRKQKETIRDLGKRVAEIAAHPRQQQTIEGWRRLNALHATRPMVTLSQLPWHELDWGAEEVVSQSGELDGNSIGDDSSSLVLAPGLAEVAHPARETGGLSLHFTVDGSLGRRATASWQVVVVDLDQSPAAPEVSIAPAAPNTADDLTVVISQSADPDGDTIDYDVAWQASLGRAAFEGLVLPASTTQRGETWHATVTPVTNPYAAVAQIHPELAISAEIVIGNATPIAAADSLVLLPNEERQIQLPGSDTDSNDSSIFPRFSIVGFPERGELRDLDEETGLITYRAFGSLASDTFLYRGTDDIGSFAEAEISLTIAGWSFPLEISDGQHAELVLGMAPRAQAGSDAFDVEAPPASPNAPSAVLLEGARKLARDIRGEAEDAVWELWLDADVDLLVKWHPERVPASGLFATPIDAQGDPGDPAETFDMANRNQITIATGESAGYRIRYAVFDFNLQLIPGWQLIGLPFSPVGVDTTFGGHISDLLDWHTGVYAQTDALDGHQGYFPCHAGEKATARLSGHAVNETTGTLQEGWNLVSIATRPGTALITLDAFLAAHPEASSTVWAFRGGEYCLASNLYPGVGYWVRASETQ